LVASPRTPSPTPAWDTGWEREAIVVSGRSTGTISHPVVPSRVP